MERPWPGVEEDIWATAAVAMDKIDAVMTAMRFMSFSLGKQFASD
jgi:hypothetical protein